MAFQYSNTIKDKYLYLMVSKKYGNAVKRNQLKRWVRIIYYQTLQEYPDLGLMVRPIKSKLTFDDVKLSFQNLILKLQEKEGE